VKLPAGMVFPFRMLRGQLPYAIEGEQGLEKRWVFRPKRAVVVEQGDAFRNRDEIRRVRFGECRNDFNDRSPGQALVP
jgi:hypothetical protein